MRVAWRKLDHRRSPAWPATGPVSARLRRARRSQFSRTWTGPPPSRPWAAPLARPSASRSRARHSMVATVPPRSSVAVEMERQMNACPCVSGCSATRQPIAGEGVVRQRPRVVLWRTVHSRRDPCDFFCCEKLELPAPFHIRGAKSQNEQFPSTRLLTTLILARLLIMGWARGGAAAGAAGAGSAPQPALRGVSRCRQDPRPEPWL
mgnify:CR=1 FL=1